MPDYGNEFIDVDVGNITTVCEKTILSVDSANEIFGKNVAPGEALPIVLRPMRNPAKPFITVPEGCYALVQRFGADIVYKENEIIRMKSEAGSSDEVEMVKDGEEGAAEEYVEVKVQNFLWPPGFYTAPPWTKVSHLITKQSFVFNTPVKQVVTKDDVPVTIDVSITIRIMGDIAKGENPNSVRDFVYGLSVSDLGTQLQNKQEEALRKVARAVNHTEVYGLRSLEFGDQVAETEGVDVEMLEKESHGGKVTDTMKEDMNRTFNPKGVQITDVAITDVRLPPKFARQMQDKTISISDIAEQKKKQENDMQLLKYDEEMETVSQRKKEEMMELEAEGVKLAAEKEKELNTELATTEKMIRELKEEELATLRTIETEAALVVKRIEMEKNTILKKINAETEAEVENIVAEGKKYIRSMQANIDLVKAKAKAEADGLRAKAEGEAAPKLRAKRKFELDLHKISVYGGLADNEQTVVSGKQGDSLLADMLVAQRQSNVLVSVDSMGGASANKRGQLVKRGQ